jgi:Na+-translocating ferredoxin:NAD+ oxidoreductase subunit E
MSRNKKRRAAAENVAPQTDEIMATENKEEPQVTEAVAVQAAETKEPEAAVEAAEPEKAAQVPEIKTEEVKTEETAEKPPDDKSITVFLKLFKKTEKNKNADKRETATKKVAYDIEKDTEEPGIGFWQNTKERILSANPVYVKAIALVPILGAAVSLKNGVMLSGVMILTVVVLNLIMYPLYRLIPRGYRTAGSLLAAGIVITPIIMLANYLAPTVAPLCGIYLPLLAVCALPMIEKSHYGQKYGIFKTALDALLNGLGFAFAAIVFSVIREIVGNGTLYDRPLPYGTLKFSFAMLPAGAFLLLGLLLALFRKIFHLKGDGGEGRG